MAKTETFRIHQRPDGRFESRNGNPMDSPLGVDPSLSMAIGSARREATTLSRDRGCTVVIKALLENTWTEVDRVEPPLAKRTAANDG